MDKLKERWGIESNWAIVAIFIAFAVNGSFAAWVAKPITNLLGLSSDTVSGFIYWPLRILLIFPIYQLTLPIVGWLFGQFKFFWAFEKQSLMEFKLLQDTIGLATANENVSPKDYEHQKTLNYIWADSYRGKRIDEVLREENPCTIDDMAKLQSDYFSIPGRTLVPMLKDVKMTSDRGEDAKTNLLAWDFVLNENSVEAAIYAMWERVIRKETEKAFIPKEVDGLISIQLEKIISWLEADGESFGPSFKKLDKTVFLQETFEQTLQKLEEKLGDDMSK